MRYLNEWISSLAAYFLLMSVLDQLLPGKKYAKYVRLFGGMILILLILSPLSRGLHLEERIARYYESFVFQNEADDLKQQLLGVEQMQLEEMIRQYENSIASDIRQMAEEESVKVLSCQVEICKEQGSERFGQIVAIRLEVCKNGEREEEVAAWSSSPEESGSTGKNSLEMASEIEPVTPVVIGAEKVISQSSQKRRGDLEEKIISYYELEDEYVEIQIVEREG